MNDEYEDLYEPREVPGHVCRCGNPDLPGRCPGWLSCPMWERADDDETEDRRLSDTKE